VDRADHVRPGDVEDLVAALETAEVVQAEVVGLQSGAHRAVGHQDAGSQGIEERRRQAIGHAEQRKAGGRRLGR
jgi:hypothetical protein